MRPLAEDFSRILFVKIVAALGHLPLLIRMVLNLSIGRRLIVVLLARLAMHPLRFDQFLSVIQRVGTLDDFQALAGETSRSAARACGPFVVRLHFLSFAGRFDDIKRELANPPADGLRGCPVLTDKRLRLLVEGRVDVPFVKVKNERRARRRFAICRLIAASAGKVVLRQTWLARSVLRSAPGRRAVIWLLVGLANDSAAFMEFFFSVAHRCDARDFEALADCACRLAKKRTGHDFALVGIYFLNRAQCYDEALRLLSGLPDVQRDGALATPARIDALFHQGSYAKALSVAVETKVLTEDLSRHGAYLLAGVAAACLKRPDLVVECFAKQVGIAPAMDAKEPLRETVWREVIDQTRRAIPEAGVLDQRNGERVGFFYHNMPRSLGHALHEPYFFLALYRHCYDRIYLVGGNLDAYQPGPRACMDIVSQYCDYVASSHGLFSNVAHFDLGQYRQGPSGFHAVHNWTLMREATLRTRDPADPFRLGAWRMALPQRFQEIGTAFCRHQGIDLARPIVAFHVRGHGYHQLKRQALRNAAIADYVPALKWLLACGYQVVRLGDSGMPRLDLGSPDYHELPFMPGYRPELDGFFVAQSEFMFTSPSGPLTYAWAFGTPVLVANAILNYLHVNPGPEMHCFKVYVDKKTGRSLSLEEAIERRLFLCIHEPELSRAGFALRDAAADEILTAVRDMAAWVHDRDIVPTDRQRRFTESADRMASELLNDANVDLPIADFIGFSMPDFRISPTVAEMRADFQVSLQ